MNRGTLSLLVGTTLATPLLCRAAAAGEKLRVLVVTGGHAFEREPFSAMFDSFAGIAWREVKHPDANAMYAPERRDSYDVVVLYDMPREMPAADQARFLETLRAGKGLVVLHHAFCSYQTWPEYRRISGGCYLSAEEEVAGKGWPKSTYHHDIPLRVTVADPAHPITRGVKDFDIVDEVYGGCWVSPDVHPLLKTDHPTSTPLVGWVVPHAQARIVTLTLGHGPTAYANANFRTLLRQAIGWAGRR